MIRQVLLLPQIVKNRRSYCQFCFHITPYLGAEEERPAIHFTPNCTHCPGLLACLTAELQARTFVISIIRKIFASNCALICASSSITVQQSMGASY